MMIAGTCAVEEAVKLGTSKILDNHSSAPDDSRQCSSRGLLWIVDFWWPVMLCLPREK